MWKCVCGCARLFAGGGEGALPLAWDQQFHFVCGTSLFSETANCIQSPAYMFVHLGGKQTAQQISILRALRERQRPGRGAGRHIARFPFGSQLILKRNLGWGGGVVFFLCFLGFF